MQIESKCIHAGSQADTISHGLNTPIFPSSGYEYLDKESVPYPRYFNTANQKVLVKKLCELEGGEDGLFFSSGMAAITTSLLGVLESGDHVVLQDEIYGGTHAFITDLLGKWGITYTFVATRLSAIEEAVTPRTKLIFIETPANPLLSIIDVKKVAELAGANNCLTMIDNTFATPILQTPIALGIDMVVHSGTKYLGGHSDLSSGCLITSKELNARVKKVAVNLGGNLNALDCYLLERSIKTLAIRVREQTRNAQKIAEFLDAHKMITKTNYPGLAHHPDYDIALQQMQGFGAMMSFEMQPGLDVKKFMQGLKLITPAVSLGGVESTITQPAKTSHAKISPEDRKRLGIGDNLLRLSVGIENAADLCEDIDKAAGSV